MTATPRYAMPFLFPAQAQKEHFHNEALATIDAALHPVLAGPPRSDPPVDASPGQCWIVGMGATADWAGRDQDLAVWTSGGWRFVAATPGMMVWNPMAAHHLVFGPSGWSGKLSVEGIAIGGDQIVGPRLPAIASPSAGTVIDGEARAAIDLLIATLKTHGLID